MIAPWCESAQCEADIKAETQATIRNMPFGQDTPTEPVHQVRQAGDGLRLVREGVLTP